MEFVLLARLVTSALVEAILVQHQHLLLSCVVLEKYPMQTLQFVFGMERLFVQLEHT